MKPIVVVGSGASAVHFALTALERGREILMLDVGRPRPATTLPDATWANLKRDLADPAEYFLGAGFEGVLYPGTKGEYYGFPPSKTHVFEGTPQFRLKPAGFSPIASFAQGGLAEAWTAGAYPFNGSEFEAFPFSYAEIAPFYDLVAGRIGVSGAADDMSRFMPVHGHLMPPLALDEHSTVLLERYTRRRAYMNERLRCYVGRSRVATLSEDKEGRRACSSCGRCLWGCPSHALYTPSDTLEVCRRFPGFRYVDGAYVRYLTVDAQRRVSGVAVETMATGSIETIEAERVVLAAGTLSSGRIFLESVYQATGERPSLGGLMDNRQVLMPFVNLSMLKRRYNPDTYQYHQLGLGLEGATAADYLHCQVTTLKTALIHPIVQRLPFDLRTSLAIFRDTHAALGLVNINLSDHRRPGNGVTLEKREGESASGLVVRYEPPPGEAARVREACSRVRRALWELGCIVPPGMTHVRPMGASVHYAGLLPMSDEAAPWTTTKDGESRDFGNLFIVDGSTLPSLPSKNVTFTLMANASRVASRMRRD